MDLNRFKGVDIENLLTVTVSVYSALGAFSGWLEDVGPVY
jgi:hypothetical protein